MSVAVTVSPADTLAPEPVMPSFVVRSRPVLASPTVRSEQEQQRQQRDEMADRVGFDPAFVKPLTH